MNNQNDEPSPFDIFSQHSTASHVDELPGMADSAPSEADYVEPAPRPSDTQRMQAREKHMAGDTVAAVTLLTQAIQTDPQNMRIAMDMVQILLDSGELEQAKALYNRLPETERESPTGRTLRGHLAFRDLAAKTAGKETLTELVAKEPDNHDATFDLAICLVAEYDYQTATDHLFAIFDQEPDYKQGAAKELIMSLANMLAANEPDLAQSIRRRLGNALS